MAKQSQNGSPGTKAKTKGNGTRTSGDKTLRLLAEENIRDIYNAEQQLIGSVPEMARAADNEELKDAFLDHLDQTRRQAERLEKVMARLNIGKEGHTCEAMAGLIKEGKRVMNEFEPGPVRDAALIIGAQKIEHYEIAVYGSVCELADVLGLTKVCAILERSLEEEKSMDRLLTDIAMDVNDEACEVLEETTGSYR